MSTLKTRLTAGITAAALLAAGAGTWIYTQAQAETPQEDQKLHLADVAATDAETGQKVLVDTQSQVLKQLGEPGKLTVDGEDKPSFEITVNSVTAMDSCQLRGEESETITPENGHFLLLDITAWLDESADEAVDEDIALMPLDASVFAVSSGANQKPDYNVNTIAAYSCAYDNVLDVAVGAGSKVSGQLMIDSPYATGQVIYDPERTGGWTWDY